MRIVLDLQAAQAESRLRGIGRYSLSLSKALVAERGSHEVVILLNGLFPDSIEAIRAEFHQWLEPEQVIVWYAPGPIACSQEDSAWRYQVAKQIRQSCIESLDPDLVLVMSWVEGYRDNTLTALPTSSHYIPTCAVLYDLIPLIYAQEYLEPDPQYKEFYLNKIEELSQLDTLLAISESSRQEALSLLGFSANGIVNISSAIEGHFQPLALSQQERDSLSARFGIHKPYVMYTGGMDLRKNVEGLIKAFARLPKSLRDRYQLVIVCAIVDADCLRLLQLAKDEGLAPDDLVFTGYVSEVDLLALYQASYLFVFPSHHEGFGLPVLEAMACGCAVICSNTSSLPEVMGLPEALFDPKDLQSMTEKFTQALSDPQFYARLKTHAPIQAGKFSWKKSAQSTWQALENFHASFSKKLAHITLSSLQEKNKPRLAFVSPLPPERSGISDYSAQLLPELARYYQIDIISAQKQIDDAWVMDHCAVYDAQWLLDNGHAYDRVLYHFGNSTFHDHMFRLLEQVPGVVVLHDFFLSGILAHQEVHGGIKGEWINALYRSHGYHAVQERVWAQDTADIVWRYPCNLPVIQNALGIIVHSDHARSLFLQWYGKQAAQDCAVIPLLRAPLQNQNRSQARANLGLAPDDFVVCSFGVLGENKLNHRLLSAWAQSSLAQNPQCVLIFVGDYASEGYQQQMAQLIAKTPNPSRVHVTRWTSASSFAQYLLAADCAVQLRANSRGETSAAVLDCFNAKLATIINRHGSLADLPEQTCWQLPDSFADTQLSHALETLWQEPVIREQLQEQAKKYLDQIHEPMACAEQYAKTLEQIYRCNGFNATDLVQEIAGAIPSASALSSIEPIAIAMARTFPMKYRQKQILVDISELVERDSRSGIQRVVRSILQEWLSHPPPGYRIEPVYASQGHGYRYARQFTLGFLRCPSDSLDDETIDFYPGDHFIGLDLQPQVVLAQQGFYKRLRQAGVCVQFVVYDLLPVLMPQFFVSGAFSTYQAWLEVVAQNDGALCISKAVSEQFEVWQKNQGQESNLQAHARWFHLGADVQSSVPSGGISSTQLQILTKLKDNPVFLMVGTLEPRKGHAQVLEAFEQLWQEGLALMLVIVGKQGWMVEELVDKIRSHPRLGKQLFWLEGVSDECLEALYEKSSCLIAASQGEGFGLPLIEAAMHGLPIIARDIAVFREVAGEHAWYFSGQAEQLAKAIDQWLGLYAQGIHPSSQAMSWKTWKQSAQALLELIVET